MTYLFNDPELIKSHKIFFYLNLNIFSQYCALYGNVDRDCFFFFPFFKSNQNKMKNKLKKKKTYTVSIVRKPKNI